MWRYKFSFAVPLGIGVFFIGLLISLTIQAAEHGTKPKSTGEANAFVLQTGQDIISVLTRTDDQKSSLKRLFQDRFDYRLMGKYALGHYWDKAPSDQRAEYTALFAEYVLNGYIGRLSDYRYADIALVRSRPLDDTDSLITTRLHLSDGDSIVLTWRVREREKQYKVIDIVVGSISYLKTLREQFTAIATRSGIDGLLDILRKHAVENAADTGSAVQNLATKLRESDAIDLAMKFSLKGKVDRLVTDLERHHDGDADEGISSLKQRFDRLIGTVVALLQGRDPSLATDIAAMRQPLWQALKDPEQFVVVAMQ